MALQDLLHVSHHHLVAEPEVQLERALGLVSRAGPCCPAVEGPSHTHRPAPTSRASLSPAACASSAVACAAPAEAARGSRSQPLPPARRRRAARRLPCGPPQSCGGKRV